MLHNSILLDDFIIFLCRVVSSRYWIVEKKEESNGDESVPPASSPSVDSALPISQLIANNLSRFLETIAI